MTGRIMKSIFATALIAVVLTAAMILWALYGNMESTTVAGLKTEANYLSFALAKEEDLSLIHISCYGRTDVCGMCTAARGKFGSGRDKSSRNTGGDTGACGNAGSRDRSSRGRHGG